MAWPSASRSRSGSKPPVSCLSLDDHRVVLIFVLSWTLHENLAITMSLWDMQRLLTLRRRFSSLERSAWSGAAFRAVTQLNGREILEAHVLLFEQDLPRFAAANILRRNTETGAQIIA